jgi:peptide deformylase
MSKLIKERLEEHGNFTVSFHHCKAAGLMAETLEHEIDHLNGTLYIDHVESQDKLHKVET